MKINKFSVSGTGNGIGEENVEFFVKALFDFSKLIKEIADKYKQEPKNTFSGKFHLINNWHGEYKIDLDNNTFPYHLCNGVYTFVNGWESAQLIVKFPLKFKAPTFAGGATDSMSVALVTEISLRKDSMSKFLDRQDVPNRVKTKLLECILEVYEDKVKTRYTESVEFLKEQAERRKISIKNKSEEIGIDIVEIGKIEEKLLEIKELLKKYES